jgi:hypothetical protein
MDEKRPRFEVADVVRVHGDDYRSAHRPSPAQERVLENIAICRTAVLGGHVDECDSGCGYSRISYNSCRDRHCPKCQGVQRAEWLDKRIERLLPVPYFHVVFTIPEELNPLALGNKEVVYKILFDAASKTLLQLARDPKHLGAQIGITAVLHTWSQRMLFRLHLHCVVTGGGLSADGTCWVAGNEDYLLPVLVLGKLFRGKFLAALEQAYKDGKLEFGGTTTELEDPIAWAGFRDSLYRKDWVVYAKPPFGGPEQVFRYLGRYTHRVAISNYRIIDFNDGKVTFTWRDYKDEGKKKLLILDAVEFLRRFLLHILPKGFVRIRHYGLCAGRNVDTKLATALRLLQHQPDTVDQNQDAPSTDDPSPWWERFRDLTGVDVMACPVCGGRLHRRRSIPSGPIPYLISAPARASPEAA